MGDDGYSTATLADLVEAFDDPDHIIYGTFQVFPTKKGQRVVSAARKGKVNSDSSYDNRPSIIDPIFAQVLASNEHVTECHNGQCIGYNTGKRMYYLTPLCNPNE